MTGEFPTQRANNAEMFPFDDVIMVGNLPIAVHFLVEYIILIAIYS